LEALLATTCYFFGRAYKRDILSLRGHRQFCYFNWEPCILYLLFL